MDDIEVIQRVLSGQRETYADLVRKYQERVLQLCESILSDPHEAEDAAQEIFIKAYQSLHKFRGASSFSTWIYRIAVNLCRDFLRQKSRRRTESWETLLEKADDRLMRLLSAPPDWNLGREDAEIIERVLSFLSPDYRMILVLREVRELSYQEIAKVMHCSLNSVKARLRRARQDLEEKLRHFLEPGDV